MDNRYIFLGEIVDEQFPPDSEQSLHLQIPAIQSATIGLTVDYTSHPPAPSLSWDSKPPTLTRYLSDANHAPGPNSKHTTPPPVVPLKGPDTPNSMAVERATEPSVMSSYSPHSSIRGCLSANVSADGDGFEFAATGVEIADTRVKTPDTEARTLVTGSSSPVETLVASPAKVAEQGVQAEGVRRENGTTLGGVSGTPAGKKFLGKGKIDAKAQDDFIAYMLAQK
jgi:hypothetical protein